MNLRGVKIGKRTSISFILGLVAGAVFFFDSMSFLGMVYNTLATGILLASIALVIENFDSRIRKLMVSILCLAILLPIIAVFNLTLISPVSDNCFTDNLVEKNLIGKKPISGEIVHKTFRGTCKEFLGFPWYYQDLNKSELINYCEENPQKRYCVVNVGSVEPSFEKLSREETNEYLS